MSEQAQRLTLSLPTQRWETAAPPEGTLFLAQRVGSFEYFRPTITVDVSELLPQATLDDVAGVLFGKVRAIDPGAEGRLDASHIDAGRLLQRIRFTLHAPQMPPLRLEQWQVIVSMPTDDPAVQATMTLVMTAEVDTIAEYGPDFESFVGSASTTQDTAP